MRTVGKDGNHNLGGKLKKNISYQTIYQLLSVITPLVVTPYISRILGSENIGIYAYTYSIAYYFVMFAMLGVINYGNRTIASVNNMREQCSRTFWEIFSFQFMMSLLMLFLYTIYVLFICESNKTIAIIQTLYVATAVFDISWLFLGVEDVKPVVLKNTIIKLLSLIGIFSLVRSKNDLWIYASLLTGGQLLGCISMWLSLRSKVDFHRVTCNSIKKHIRPNITLFIPVIAISVYKTLDKIMIGYLANKSQVGFYTNAESLINAPMGFIIAVGVVMLPRITNLLANNKTNESILYFRKSLQITMCFSCAAAFGIVAVAPVFVPIYYGKGYDDCVFLLEGQSIVMIFLAWANVIRTQYLLPHKHDKQYILSILFGAAINVILNFLLIPQYQSAGALVATIFAEAIVCAIQTLDAAKHINIIECIKENLYFVFSGGVMLSVVRLVALKMSGSVISLLMQIAIGAIVYFIMIVPFYLRKKKTI